MERTWKREHWTCSDTRRSFQRYKVAFRTAQSLFYKRFYTAYADRFQHAWQDRHRTFWQLQQGIFWYLECGSVPYTAKLSHCRITPNGGFWHAGMEHSRRIVWQHKRDLRYLVERRCTACVKRLENTMVRYLAEYFRLLERVGTAYIWRHKRGHNHHKERIPQSVGNGLETCVWQAHGRGWQRLDGALETFAWWVSRLCWNTYHKRSEHLQQSHSTCCELACEHTRTDSQQCAW